MHLGLIFTNDDIAPHMYCVSQTNWDQKLQIMRLNHDLQLVAFFQNSKFLVLFPSWSRLSWQFLYCIPNNQQTGVLCWNSICQWLFNVCKLCIYCDCLSRSTTWLGYKTILSLLYVSLAKNTIYNSCCTMRSKSFAVTCLHFPKNSQSPFSRTICGQVVYFLITVQVPQYW